MRHAGATEEAKAGANPGASPVTRVPAASPREDRTNELGVALVLAAVVMLFAGLLFAYAYLRLEGGTGLTSPQAGLGMRWNAAASLALLLGSSLLLGHGRSARRSLAAAGLGLAFLGSQAVLVRRLFLAGVVPSAGLWAGLVWLLVAVHGVHVTVGLAGLGQASLRPEAPRRRLWGLYWHTVGAVGTAFLGVLFWL